MMVQRGKISVYIDHAYTHWVGLHYLECADGHARKGHEAVLRWRGRAHAPFPARL